MGQFPLGCIGGREHIGAFQFDELKARLENPFPPPLAKLARFDEPDVRVRWEPAPVVVKIIQAMSTQWMQEVSLFAVATGMRANEILSLTWAQVDLGKRHAG